MGDGPYRVGNHSPLNVWCEPGQSTHEQVCMATSPRWAGRIVAALNEQDAHGVGERAVSDAVASAHLSGVDLPADWVDTLGKVARGEVTVDDAVQTAVDDELRRRIASRIVEAWVGREPLTIVAYADALARQAMEVVAPALRKAYLDGHDSGFAAANVPDPWAKTPAVDGDLQHQIVRSLWDAAEICLSDSQLSVMADAVISDVVAPMLAAKDAALGWEQSSKQQYAEERDEALDDAEQLRSALSKALADLVVRRQALANVLGVTDAGGASGYYRMIQDVADLRAELGAIRARAQLAEDERDKANRQNESLARRLHLRFQNEQKLSAELAAVKSKRMWRTAPISGVMHLVPDGDGRRESVCGLVGSTTWQPAVDGNARCLECERWQPDTEATKPRHVDIDIRDHVVTGEAIAENPEWAHTAFVMAADVRTIIREWCAANGIPVDTEATEATEQAASSVADFVLYPPVGWLNRIDEVLRYHGAADCDGSAVGEALGTLIRSWRDEQARHSPDCGPEEWGPREATEQAPREPRVWREGDTEPDDVYEVSDRHGGRWSRRHDGFWVGLNKHGFARWDQLLQFTVGGLTEVVVDGTQ